MTTRIPSGVALHAPEVMRSVTPNDAADLPDGPCRALRCTSGGTVVVVDRSGNQVTLQLEAVGWDPIVAARVLTTGTTATGIVAGY